MVEPGGLPSVGSLGLGAHKVCLSLLSVSGVWDLILNLVKAMSFSVVMYGCESWTIEKAER